MNPAMRRILRTWAGDAVAHARRLAEIDPSWGTEIHAVSDGWLVLSGPGLYVNRAMAVGLDTELDDADIDLVVDRSRALGLRPEVEVSPATQPSVLDRLRSRGFTADPNADVVALTRPIPGPDVVAPDDVEVQPIVTAHDLQRWQEISATGWGHHEPAARRASDAFTLAAHAVDGDGMMIAVDAGTGAALGCASTTVSDGIATFGGMSTDPAHRRRGVQAALISRRRQLAAERGCDLAATTTYVGSASERNLRRHGFEPLCVIGTWSLADPAVG